MLNDSNKSWNEFSFNTSEKVNICLLSYIDIYEIFGMLYPHIDLWCYEFCSMTYITLIMKGMENMA